MNDTAKRNLETLRNNIAVYASFIDRSIDSFGQIDVAVQEAEDSVSNLLRLVEQLEAVSTKRQKGGTAC